MSLSKVTMVVMGGLSRLALSQGPRRRLRLRRKMSSANSITIRASLSISKASTSSKETRRQTTRSRLLTKMGAREVSAGAIIFRSGDKLYIVDGTPPADASPQAMKDFQSNWNVSYMKNFQENFATSYMK